MSYGMSFGFSQEQRLDHKMSLRQEHSVDYPKVIESIRSHFSSTEDFPTDVSRLKQLLRTIPQRQNGRLAYVIGGGWAVEVLTGKAREHGNINVLVVDSKRTTLESNRCLDYLGVQYLDKALADALVKRDVIKGNWTRGECDVYVPSHEFMVGTKLLPRTVDEGNRDKDIADLVELLIVHAPDFKKLARVLDSLPYVNDGDTVARIAYRISGSLKPGISLTDDGFRVNKRPKRSVERKAAYALRLLNDVLREQLCVYDEKWKMAQAGRVLEAQLSMNEYDGLKKYHEREGSAENFFKWLSDNREKLVNPHNKIYYPRHPDKKPIFMNKTDYVSALADGIIDRDAFDVMMEDAEKHPPYSAYSVRSVSEGGSYALLVWNPKGKLIYENWKK